MQMVFRVVYSLVVAILFVLFAILGTRTFYPEPEPELAYPIYPNPPSYSTKSFSCDMNDVCYRDGQPLTAEDEASLTEAERRYLQEMRTFERRQREYADDRADYHRNVFILASAMGVAAVAGGLYLFRRVEAMPLGLLLGGLGVIIFGWVQAADEFDEVGAAPLFVAVGLGLAVVLAAGYWFLSLRGAAGGGTGEG